MLVLVASAACSGSLKAAGQRLLAHEPAFQQRVSVNLIRTVMTLFLLCVIALCIAGWIWAGRQPSPTLEGARIALGLSGLIVAGSIFLLWREKDPTHGNGSR
jgi:hypothetical protein